MKYYYARVSTAKQNLARQIELFKELGGNKRTIFEEKRSGANFEDREAWDELVECVRSNDVIVVKNLDRLGRNAQEVRECLVKLADKKVIVESIDQEYLNEFLKTKLVDKTADSLAEAMLNAMLDTMLEVDLLRAEWERRELRKRQQEGIERAKARGQHLGRNKEEKYREKFKEIYRLTRDKDNPDYISITKACKEIGCSRPMFYKMEKEVELEKNIL